MAIRKGIIDELIRGYKNTKDLLGENGLLKQLTKALLERAMNAELTLELGFERHDKSSLKETAIGAMELSDLYYSFTFSLLN